VVSDRTGRNSAGAAGRWWCAETVAGRNGGISLTVQVVQVGVGWQVVVVQVSEQQVYGAGGAERAPAGGGSSSAGEMWWQCRTVQAQKAGVQQVVSCRQASAKSLCSCAVQCVCCSKAAGKGTMQNRVL